MKFPKSCVFLILVFLTLCETLVWAEKIRIVWQKVLGGSGREAGLSAALASDGGYVILGYTNSNDGDVKDWHEGFDEFGHTDDFWIVKLDNDGTIVWQKTFGGSKGDMPGFIAAISTGEHIVVGTTFSNDGDVTMNHGENDAWIVRLDDDGNILWQKTLGGSRSDMANSAAVTPDGGYIMVGRTNSVDGDVSGWHEGYNEFGPNHDFWIVKLDNEGNVEWQKTLGGSGDDVANSVVVTPDGGYIVAGETNSNDGDVIGNHGGWERDFWVVKLDNEGNIEWQRVLGRSGDDRAESVAILPDGRCVVAGYTDSNDGDVKGWHEGYDVAFHPYSDFWVIKLNSKGKIEWQKTLGGSDMDYAYSIAATTDGGYIVVGGTYSNDGDVSKLHEKSGYSVQRGSDFWIVKLDSERNIEWQKKLGSSDYESAYHVLVLPEGEYIVVGCTSSGDGDVKGWHPGFDLFDRSSDVWVIKLKETNR